MSDFFGVSNELTLIALGCLAFIMFVFPLNSID